MEIEEEIDVLLCKVKGKIISPKEATQTILGMIKREVNKEVLCIDEGDWMWISKGKTYNVLFIYNDSYIIIDDDGEIIAPEKELFKIVKENGNSKI